jgi:hypothetical protein
MVNRERVHVADMKPFHGVDETPDIPFLLETVKLPAASSWRLLERISKSEKPARCRRSGGFLHCQR